MCIHHEAVPVGNDPKAVASLGHAYVLDDKDVLSSLLDPDDQDVIVELAKVAGITPLELLQRQLSGTVIEMTRALQWFNDHEGNSKEREYAKALLRSPGPESLTEGLQACDPSYQANESTHRRFAQRQALENWQTFKAN